MELGSACDGPVAIRFPRGAGARPDAQLAHQPFSVGEAERVADGDDGCLLAYGPATYIALEVRRRLLESTGRTVAVINARFAKPLDERLITTEFARQPFVFTLEDHAVAGGFGAAVAEFLFTRGEQQVDANRLEIIGLPDRFIDHGERVQQLADAGLDADAITERVRQRIEQLRPARPPVRLAKGK
jgi:1-deoxy-D-xylulose-5-phosphate synthase